MRFTFTQPKHFHRLKPASQFAQKNRNRYDRVSDNNNNNQSFTPFSFGNRQPLQPAHIKPLHHFFFDDEGKLYFGQNEDDCIRIDTDLTLNPEILPADLQNAFLLGMAVSHLQHTEMSDCNPIALQLLNELKGSY